VTEIGHLGDNMSVWKSKRFI